MNEAADVSSLRDRDSTQGTSSRRWSYSSPRRRVREPLPAHVVAAVVVDHDATHHPRPGFLAIVGGMAFDVVDDRMQPCLLLIDPTLRQDDQARVQALGRRELAEVNLVVGDEHPVARDHRRVQLRVQRRQQPALPVRRPLIATGVRDPLKRGRHARVSPELHASTDIPRRRRSIAACLPAGSAAGTASRRALGRPRRGLAFAH
jgi:hypothetical protein